MYLRSMCDQSLDRHGYGTLMDRNCIAISHHLSDSVPTESHHLLHMYMYNCYPIYPVECNPDKKGGFVLESGSLDHLNAATPELVGIYS